MNRTNGPAGQPSGRRAPLTTERVLDAALDIVDAAGVDGLSMRKLAQSLDREVMTLYRYSHNKAALLDGVVATSSSASCRSTRTHPADSRSYGTCPAISASSPWTIPTSFP